MPVPVLKKHDRATASFQRAATDTDCMDLREQLQQNARRFRPAGFLADVVHFDVADTSSLRALRRLRVNTDTAGTQTVISGIQTSVTTVTVRQFLNLQRMGVARNLENVLACFATRRRSKKECGNPELRCNGSARK